ncbi:DUF368 domain-containing protein [Vibrio sp.]|nr:DUF368 domain-containing protein [Vibrio sp.]
MNYFSTFIKGLAMGAADVVPGVSGGTIAFITGIYDTLLESIRRINPSLIKRLKNEGVKAAFEHINGTFLIALLSGILISIASLAKLITWLLVAHPLPLWSFFFGLILVSVYHMMKQIEHRSIITGITLFLGIGFALVITVMNPLHMEFNHINIMIAGSIAICAMILPGISGSFILVLLGMYSPVLSAIKSVQVDVILTFMVGAVLGLLTFSHLLSWLLNKYRDITLTFLIGLMIGTLPKIWPWKQTLTTRINSKGEEVPLTTENLLPSTFETITGDSAQLAFCISMALAAIVLVLLLEKVAERNQ